ncbi:MAG: hypothetical protein ACFFDI_04310 [Promethearchaeota archaeon]
MEATKKEFYKTQKEYNPPPNKETEGRPMWWHNGSYFIPTSGREKRLAVLHQHTLAKDEDVLSNKARKIQRTLSALSKWFPITLLDEAGKFLLLQDEPLPREHELLLKILGIVEALLRDKKLSLRWNVLAEISETFETNIEKPHYAKYLFWAKSRLKIPSFDAYAIVKRLVIAEIASKRISTDEKRILLGTVVEYCNYLKKQNFIFKDPELCAYAVARLALKETGPMNLPPNLRKKVSRLAYRIKKMLCN